MICFSKYHASKRKVFLRQYGPVRDLHMMTCRTKVNAAFEKAGLFYTAFGHDMLSCKLLLFQNLKEVPSLCDERI